jgi:hypothetical protein
METDQDHQTGILHMLRFVILVVFFSACSSTVKKGGEKTYAYQLSADYSREQLKEMAPEMITTLSREPQVGKLKDLFSKGQPPIKRIGVVVFESMIQNSLSGLASEDRVYLSDQGKQVLTEQLLSVWEEAFPILDPTIDYVPTLKIKRAKDFTQYGTDVTDYVIAKRNVLAPDDVFFLQKGMKISSKIFHSPRGMRDVSFLLVPATELMSGPKWSEQNKHFINDVAKDLNLDAVIIVQSGLKWTKEATNKNSGEITPEEIQVGIKASILVPLTRYHERLKHSGESATPNHTMSYRTYESLVKFPVDLSVSKEEETFETAMKNVISPALKGYRDLTFMTIDRMISDIQKTR